MSLRPLQLMALVATLALASPAAHAQAASDSLGAAQALFDRAVVLMGERKFDEACPKLEEVVRLVPDGLGAKLRLADCYEQAGQVASAWTTYVLAEESARRDGQTARAALAHERAESLAPRLRRLRIDVAASARAIPELVVRRDGRVVRSPEWGVGVPVDPGRHVVEAEAPDHQIWRSSVEIAATDASIEVPALARNVAASPPVGPSTGLAAATPSTEPTSPPVDTETRVPAWAWVSGGAGIALAGVAVGFFIDQASAQSDIDANCTADKCGSTFDSASANERLNRDFGLAVGFGTASLLGIGAAIVGIATAPVTRVGVSRDAVSFSVGGGF